MPTAILLPQGAVGKFLTFIFLYLDGGSLAVANAVVCDVVSELKVVEHRLKYSSLKPAVRFKSAKRRRKLEPVLTQESIDRARR